MNKEGRIGRYWNPTTQKYEKSKRWLWGAKLCRTHIVGDIESAKPGCYSIWCKRCGFVELIGSWYVEMWKVKGRYVWSKKQWPFIFAALQMLELGRRTKFTNQYYEGYYSKKDEDKVIKEVKEYWHKWIEENIK